MFNLRRPSPSSAELGFPELVARSPTPGFLGERAQRWLSCLRATVGCRVLSPRARDVAFSPEDGKESFQTGFGFIFQRPGLGILRPEDVAWRGGPGVSERKEGAAGSGSYPSFPQPQK